MRANGWVLGAILAVAACGGGDADDAVDAAPAGSDAAPCSGVAGEHHDQALTVDGEERWSWLYVPAAYDCADAWPLLVDFHGTSGGAEPEISYKTAELVALAEAEGFIVVRPRSRSSDEGGDQIFRWDQNAGDLVRNVAFTKALVADLSARYHVDPARTYASGFSSGTNMAAQFLDEDEPFVGFGMVAGGFWSAPGPIVGTRRVYDVTGWRDYLYESAEVLHFALLDAGVPAENLFFRRTDSGHELYGWHFEEMWAFLDRGERPGAGSPGLPWAREEGAPTADLTEVARAPGGAVVATGAFGSIWRRDAAGVWTEVEASPGPPLTGVCLFASGRGVAVGAGRTFLTVDGGVTWDPHGPLRGTSGFGFDPAYLNGVACGGDGRAIAAGYWDALVSIDEGEAFEATPIDSGFDFPSQAAAVVADALGGGGLLALGYYDYVGRAAAGGELAPVRHGTALEWWNGGALRGSLALIVGEAGTIRRSIDGGLTWTDIATPTDEDLYAVAMRGDVVGLAVGAHGTALLTLDGGLTWSESRTDVDGSLAGIAWLDETRAVIVGAGGPLLFDMPALAKFGD